MNRYSTETRNEKPEVRGVSILRKMVEQYLVEQMVEQYEICGISNLIIFL